jgi:hypothetical protein
MSGIGLEVVTWLQYLRAVLYAVLPFHHVTSVNVMSAMCTSSLMFIHCAIRGHSMLNVFSTKLTAI